MLLGRLHGGEVWAIENCRAGASDFLRSKSEEALYLLPDNDAQPNAEGDEGDEDEPEAKPRPPTFALANPVRAPSRTVQSIRLLHCDRVELERFFGVQASSRLGHAGSLVP